LQNRQSAINKKVPWRVVQPRPHGDEVVAAFARWAAEQRTTSAAADRSRARSLREQASASATWKGMLVDLAEQDTPVTAVVAGQRRSGQIVGVGQDFFVIQPRQGRPALVCLDAVSALWPEMDSLPAPPAGDRSPAISLSLLSALARLAEDRCPMGLLTRAGFEVAGDLVAAGEDVLTVRTAPPARRLVSVPFGAVALCELR
jgi:hypothetical protein